MQLLSLPNLIQLKDDFPGVFDDLQRFVNFTNQHVALVGGYSQLTLAGSIAVTGGSGIVDVALTDNAPRAGEEYFVEYALVPSFTGAHTISLGPGRNRRFSDLAGLTTFWRFYKSTKLGGTSNIITFGSPPIGVTPGGAAGPAPPAGSGSGTSGSSGGGYGGGGARGCVLKGTKIVPLGKGAKITALPNSEWIAVKLANGMSLTATPDHPVMTERGKYSLETLSIGTEVITGDGLSPISSLKAFRRKGVKMKVSMAKGHLFWANGILSHNFKLL